MSASKNVLCFDDEDALSRALTKKAIELRNQGKSDQDTSKVRIPEKQFDDIVNAIIEAVKPLETAVKQHGAAVVSHVFQGVCESVIQSYADPTPTCTGKSPAQTRKTKPSTTPQEERHSSIISIDSTDEEQHDDDDDDDDEVMEDVIEDSDADDDDITLATNKVDWNKELGRSQQVVDRTPNRARKDPITPRKPTKTASGRNTKDRNPPASAPARMGITKPKKYKPKVELRAELKRKGHLPSDEA